MGLVTSFGVFFALLATTFSAIIAAATAMATATSLPALTPLQYGNRTLGQPIKPGTELRILPVGDSITVGYESDNLENGVAGDGNGYRLELRNDLAEDTVIFAGTVESVVGTMSDGWFAAWSGQTIQYIADHVTISVKEMPNIILLHAGTNDMNEDTANIALQGNDPVAAVARLSSLIAQMLEINPTAVIIVAMIIHPCSDMAFQRNNTIMFNSLIPDMVYNDFYSNGYYVLAADFSTFPSDSELQDCIHPTAITGYHLLGDYWYDFVSQIPSDWIQDPIGPDPNRTTGISANGGLATDIPAPDYGTDPVEITSYSQILSAWVNDTTVPNKSLSAVCTGNVWYPTGEIALGLGHLGTWLYQKNWVQAGEVASGFGRDPNYVSLHDMNGDGRADYVWLDPDTGMIVCWLNNLPDAWSPAGTNNSIIWSGAGPAESVFIADMNGDGLEDYMVVDPYTGAVEIWWNWGADDDSANGWNFTAGGQIASGVPNANWYTIRFPDINGDGRADYVVVGESGSLLHYMNTGTVGGQDVLFLAQGGIASGAVVDISDLVFADVNGDGRDDYLIWDGEGGLTGYLNQPTYNEGVPLYVSQGSAKAIADGITQAPSSIRLADLDGDGKDDYAYIDQNGTIWLWWNEGDANSTTALDGVRFADINGDGLDDYVWLDPITGAPTVYLPSSEDSLGWSWTPLNGGSPIASGAAPASLVQFGDINGDGLDDYLVFDSQTGELAVYLNGGPSTSDTDSWIWEPIGSIATGLGPGAIVRFADIDGDGYDDYIFLHSNGSTIVYRNVYSLDTPLTWEALPSADSSGISQRPEEIQFADINGDGKADYIWTRSWDGAVFVWLNDYPNLPTWVAQGQVFDGIAASGSLVRPYHGCYLGLVEWMQHG
ncbi:hypothetical protein BX600DRAFT_496225 [Xylariales sp. PMI_506]|nr:hypothetical protein BX600DRAFT_496225 [Xylariales sp. PMI_506]